MISEAEILTALRQVIDPEIGKSIVDLGMVRNLKLDEQGKIAFTLALTVPTCPAREQMAANARQVLAALPDVKQVEIAFGMMTEEERKAVVAQIRTNLPRLNAFNKVEGHSGDERQGRRGKIVPDCAAGSGDVPPRAESGHPGCRHYRTKHPCSWAACRRPAR